MAGYTSGPRPAQCHRCNFKRPPSWEKLECASACLQLSKKKELELILLLFQPCKCLKLIQAPCSRFYTCSGHGQAWQASHTLPYRDLSALELLDNACASLFMFICKDLRDHDPKAKLGRAYALQVDW